MSQISRRDFLKIFGLTAAGAAAWKLGVPALQAGLVEVSMSRVLMGTVVNLTVVGESKAAGEQALVASLDHMRSLESALSRHQPQSELSRLNATGSLAEASDGLLAVLRRAQQVSAQTGGAFDVTVKPLLDLYRAAQRDGGLPADSQLAAVLPLVDYRNLLMSGRRVAFARQGMGITLDGIGKGYIVDEGTQALRQHGFENVLVEAGGDLLASGVKAPGSPWMLGVQPPRSGAGTMAARFHVQDRAVATSGDYMQPFTPDFSRHHILDPRRGVSPPALSSVSVVAGSGAMADALSTAVMVMGPQEGLRLIERWPDVEALLITKAGDVYRSSAFPAEA